MFQEVYKVVRLRDRDQKLVSCMMDDNNPGYLVEYVVGDWAKPVVGTLLFAFGALGEAVDFATLHAHWWRSAKVFRALAEDPKELLWCSRPYDELIKGFWERLIDGTSSYAIDESTPEGTVGCKRIKLIESVWTDEELYVS